MERAGYEAQRAERRCRSVEPENRLVARGLETEWENRLRQGRKTATGERFTANQVGSLRRYRGIPRYQPPAAPPDRGLVSIRKAAQILVP